MRNRWASFIITGMAAWITLVTYEPGRGEAPDATSEPAEPAIHAAALEPPNPIPESVNEEMERSRPHFQAAFPRAGADATLALGDTRQQVRSRFAAPDAVRRVGYADSPEVYEGWRYEDAEHQLDITWSAEGQVLAFTLAYPERSGGRTTVYRAGLSTSGEVLYSDVPLLPSREYAVDWTFQSGLRYTYLVGRAGGSLFVLGDDGGYSGAHFDSTLYGIDAETGRKLWEAPGKFGGVAFSASSDGRHAAILTWVNPATKEYETKLQWMDAQSGAVEWEQRWQEKPQTVSRMASADGVVVVEQRQDSSAGAANAFQVLHERTGDLLWEKKLSDDEKLLYESSGPNVIVIGSCRIQAYDPLTGQVAWVKDAHVKDWTLNNKLLRRMELSGIDVRRLQEPSESDRKLWILLEEGFTSLDLSNGATLAVLPYEPGNYYSSVGEDYMFIHKSDTSVYWKGRDFTTGLYDLKRKKLLWVAHGRGAYGVIQGDTLYYLLDDRPMAVDRESGTLLWQAPYTVGEMERGESGGDKQLLVAGDELWVPGNEQLFVLDRLTGALKHRLGNAVLGSAAIRPYLTDYGMVTSLQDGLYLGSANGTFTKLRPPDTTKIHHSPE
ncbi:PQQ-binding-like beta-propeller repeat protein [Paenibacillus sp. HJGM_3]|uniref:outer membrane protein assembly factor BamB family protein n=1 Tax=Paenibacillus sp. HJGM_3 TaxID=3379816 RepID=UPI00385E9805